MDSRVLREKNGPNDALIERDNAGVKHPISGGTTGKQFKHGTNLKKAKRGKAAAASGAERTEAGPVRDQKGSHAAATKQGAAEVPQGPQQQQQSMSMEGDAPPPAVTSTAAPQPNAVALAAARLAAGAAQQQPRLLDQQQQQQPGDDACTADDEAGQPGAITAAGAAAAAEEEEEWGGQGSDGAASEPGSASDGSDSDAPESDVSGDGDGSPLEQPAGRQQRDSRGVARQQQPQAQEPAGRPRRAAAAAASDRMRSAEATALQQEQAIRRSSRVRRATTAAAQQYYDDSDEDDELPVARPRRAAAAAAKQATAAALAAEATAWASQPDSESDLGTPDASDAEEDAVAASSEGEEEGGALSDSGGSEDEGDVDGSGGGSSWGTGKRPRQRVQPRRGRGARAVVALDESDEPDSQADDGSPEAAGDLPVNLSAFAFNGNAAAAGGRGQGTRRGSNGSGSGASREGSAEADTAQLAAMLQAEEELKGDVADASEFAPMQLDKLARGDDVDKCLDVSYGDDDSITVLAKLVGQPYRHAVWLPAAAIEAKRPSLLRNFLSRHAGGDADTDWADNNNINPAWYRIDRIVAESKQGRKTPVYLVKWCGLEYSESTWEDEEEICRDGAGQVALARFRRWSTPPATRPLATKRPRQELLDKKLLPDFKNGRKLRDYQEESLHWMVNNYRGQVVSGKWKSRNCILGDEMGLGKTAQSIAVMSWLRQYAGASAPCMVVAPLTTLGHWKREIETWTDLNVVLYAGTAEDRRLIREYEFFYPGRKTAGVRFNVLLASYETVLRDKGELRKLHFEALIVDEAHRLKNQKSATRLALQEMPVRWLLMLSGTPVQNNMKELQGLMSLLDQEAYGDADEFLEKYGSDTPSLEQIRALQAALAPVLLRRMKEDVEDLPEKEEVVIWVELTAEQRRYYRALYSQQIGALLGGGSNKNLPSMRNLAMELRKLCCHPFLCDGLEDDMTLRWAEAQAGGEPKTQREREIENYTRASGKMLLLHKLLPKLRAEGRQVLIFSQFKMMLDVIEDYLTACEYPFERIDGDTKHSARQAAIDRFMAVQDRPRSKTPTSRAASPSAEPATGSDQAGGEAAAAASDKPGQPSAGSSRATSPPGAEAEGEGEDGPFVFLLSTRAGGQGITLTSADTVILYDSDWNPQNDLQAMARCHRIGQKKEVMVYRLVSKNTYEQQLFECSSRKMGLDEAILGFAGTGENPENDAARIEQLLRLGAHAILGGGEGGAGAGDAAGEDKGFAAEDIEQILVGRSEKRQLGNRKGNTFSIAHFGDGGGELDPELELELQQQEEAQVAAKDAKTFWAELLPEAAADHAARAKSKQPELLGPRRRNKVDYREANMGTREVSGSDLSLNPEEEEEGEDGDSLLGSKGAKRSAEPDGLQGPGSKKQKKKGDELLEDAELGRVVQPWRAAQVEVVREALLRYGADRLDKVVAQSLEAPALQLRQADEVRQLCRALTLVLEEMVRLAPALQQEEKAAKEALTAAAAAGDAAAAAQAKASHGNLSSHYVNTLRDRLLAAGLEGKLPRACSKALLSLDTVRKMGRAPAAMQQQLQDHHKVHQAMLAAGLAKDASSSKANAEAGSSQQQQQEGEGKAEATSPAQAPPAAAAAASAAGSSAPNGDAPKRVWVAPRVLLKGSKGVPAWWKREHDDLLLQGCYAYGYAGGAKLNSIVEDILGDTQFGLSSRLAVDPVGLLREQAELAAPRPPPKYEEVQVAQPDGTTRTERRMVLPPPVQLDPNQQAAAQRQKQQLQQAHPGIELLQPMEWRRVVGAIGQRLKRVRSALLDPTYVEPATPSKQLHRMVNSIQPPAPAAAGGGGHVVGGNVQQRLQLTPAGDGSLLYKGKKVIGGGLPPAAAAAAAADGRAVARTPPGFGTPQLAVLSPAQQQQLANHQRAISQHNMAQLVNNLRAVASLHAVSAQVQAQAQARKRQAEEQQQLGSAAKRPNSSLPSPVGAQPQALLTPQAIMAQAAEAARQVRLQEQRRLLEQQTQQAMQQRQQQQQQPRQQQPEVVELLDDDSDDGEEQTAPPARSKPAHAATPGIPAASAAAAAAAPGPAPPSSGLVVRRVPAGADLSQEQSVDEPTGAQGAAGGTMSSSGKQHMQQLLGNNDAKAAGNARPKGAGKAAAAEHPVYGTPAGAAAATASGATGGGGRRKQGKDDPKQRKLDSFFAVSK